jgi:predicted ester cyclase
MEDDRDLAAEQALAEKVRRVWEIAYNGGDLTVLDEIASDEKPFTCNVYTGQRVEGVEAIKDSLARHREAIRDFHIAIEELLVQGETVSMWWTVTGRFERPLLEFEPTGKPIRYSGATLLKFDDGTMVRGRICADFEAQLRDRT